MDKITASLSDAQVDLNPHQVDAALFALRSPLSRGVILADEVGLGKTIEAGIVVAQRWAEHKRRILIIAPANLRKQWQQEMMDKFFLPSVILEKKSFELTLKNRNLNPFNQLDTIVICSFQFAKAKDAYVQQTPWDLVVIDEAHRLRNVYRKDNKIGAALKEALRERPKILLTATPLQNSLLELYGLVSLVDDYLFGDLRSFKQQYAKMTNESQFLDLKRRIAPVCKRTLRAQVKEYINYTNRICLTREFTPNDKEHQLYVAISDYLQKEKLYALPNSQRQLMTLILRKLMASSTFAIADTLKGLADKLDNIIKKQAENAVSLLSFSRNTEGAQNWETDYELTEEIKDEWADDPDFEDYEKAETYYSPLEIEEIKQEHAELTDFYALAKSIKRNSKGDNLVDTLTVISHENFDAIIEASKDPNSVFKTMHFVKLDPNAAQNETTLLTIPDRVSQRSKDEQERIGTLQNTTEKQRAQTVLDVTRALVNVLPLAASVLPNVKSVTDLATPEAKAAVLMLLKKDLASRPDNLFKAEDDAKIEEKAKEIYDKVVQDFAANIIEIPRLSRQMAKPEAYFEDFDLDTTGQNGIETKFEAHEIDTKVIRENLENHVRERFDLLRGANHSRLETPDNQIVAQLMNYSEVYYDKFHVLLFKLVRQAIAAMRLTLLPSETMERVVLDNRKLIAARIYAQMKKHFTLKPSSFGEVSILPFQKIEAWNITLPLSAGRLDYQNNNFKKNEIRRLVFMGFQKAAHPEYVFDSASELAFARVLERDETVEKWLRPAPQQFNITYWHNEEKKYEPDFVVETPHVIFLIEVKAADDMTHPDVVAKAQAVTLYCTDVSKYLLEQGKKTWQYALIAHDAIQSTSTLGHLVG